MKLTILGVFIILLHTVTCEDVYPPTPAEFVNATLNRGYNSFYIVTKDRQIQLINVPDVLQPTTYSCGPSSMRAVLHFYGVNIRQSEIMAAAGTIPNKGTGPIMLQNGFNKLMSSSQRKLTKMLQIQRIQNMSIKQLQQFLIDRIPVIVLLQHFKPADDPRSYKDYNDRGHYIVAIGMDDQNYYFEDPKCLNNIMFIKKNEFEDRWHDYLSSEKRLANKVGLIIRRRDGRAPAGETRLKYIVK